MIDAGGGQRGVYGAGVLDRCLDDGVRFDAAIGVSAGSANLASFLAGQRGRNYRFYTSYSLRPAYMGARRMLRGGGYLGLDYIYGTLSQAGGEDALALTAMCENPAAYYALATDANTGEPVCFTKDDLYPDDLSVLSASCAIPLFCRPCTVNGAAYFDGGLSDPVPVGRALKTGARRIVLILTRPVGDVPDERIDLLCARLIRSGYPLAAERLRQRGLRYRLGVALARKLSAEGRCLIVSPTVDCGVRTFTRDPARLDRLYRTGLSDGAAIARFLNESK